MWYSTKFYVLYNRCWRYDRCIVLSYRETRFSNYNQQFYLSGTSYDWKHILRSIALFTSDICAHIVGILVYFLLACVELCRLHKREGENQASRRESGQWTKPCTIVEIQLCSYYSCHIVRKNECAETKIFAAISTRHIVSHQKRFRGESREAFLFLSREEVSLHPRQVDPYSIASNNSRNEKHASRRKRYKTVLLRRNLIWNSNKSINLWIRI